VSNYLDNEAHYASTQQALLQVKKTLAAVEKNASLAAVVLEMSGGHHPPSAIIG